MSVDFSVSFNFVTLFLCTICCDRYITGQGEVSIMMLVFYLYVSSAMAAIFDLSHLISSTYKIQHCVYTHKAPPLIKDTTPTPKK